MSVCVRAPGSSSSDGRHPCASRPPDRCLCREWDGPPPSSLSSPPCCSCVAEGRRRIESREGSTASRGCTACRSRGGGRQSGGHGSRAKQRQRSVRLATRLFVRRDPVGSGQRADRRGRLATHRLLPALHERERAQRSDGVRTPWTRVPGWALREDTQPIEKKPPTQLSPACAAASENSKTSRCGELGARNRCGRGLGRGKGSHLWTLRTTSSPKNPSSASAECTPAARWSRRPRRRHPSSLRAGREGAHEWCGTSVGKTFRVLPQRQRIHRWTGEPAGLDTLAATQTSLQQ